MGETRPQAPEALQLELTPTITPEMVDGVARLVKITTVPLRDKFTQDYDFRPNPKGVNGYVQTTIKRLFNGEVATNQEEQDALDRRRGYTYGFIVEDLQATTWVNAAIARYRHEYLGRALEAIELGEAPSEQTRVVVANAVEDFGRSLVADQAVSKREGSVAEVGASIVNLGVHMQTDPELPGQFPALLDAVRFEQTKRELFWSARFYAADAVYGNRLNPSNLAAEGDLEAMLDLQQRGLVDVQL